MPFEKHTTDSTFWYCKTYGTDRSYGGNDGYEDHLESSYEYHQYVKNSRRIKEGDFLIFCNRQTVLGIGCVQNIRRDRGTILRRRCPTCGETDIDLRKVLTPKWRCRNAHQFAEPREEIVECWRYSAAYPDTYVQMNDSESLSEVLKARHRAATIDSIVSLDKKAILGLLQVRLSTISLASTSKSTTTDTTSLDNGLRSIGDVLQSIAENEFPEGALLYRQHLARERNANLVRCVKLRAKLIHGCLCCEACNFNFHEVYGEVGDDYIECHHTVPVSELLPGSKTDIADVVLLCANCHRVVHRRRPWLNLASLKELITKSRSATPKLQSLGV